MSYSNYIFAIYLDKSEEGDPAHFEKVVAQSLNETKNKEGNFLEDLADIREKIEKENEELRYRNWAFVGPGGEIIDPDREQSYDPERFRFEIKDEDDESEELEEEEYDDSTHDDLTQDELDPTNLYGMDKDDSVQQSSSKDLDEKTSDSREKELTHELRKLTNALSDTHVKKQETIQVLRRILEELEGDEIPDVTEATLELFGDLKFFVKNAKEMCNLYSGELSKILSDKFRFRKEKVEEYQRYEEDDSEESLLRRKLLFQEIKQLELNIISLRREYDKMQGTKYERNSPNDSDIVFAYIDSGSKAFEMSDSQVKILLQNGKTSVKDKLEVVDVGIIYTVGKYPDSENLGAIPCLERLLEQISQFYEYPDSLSKDNVDNLQDMLEYASEYYLDASVKYSQLQSKETVLFMNFLKNQIEGLTQFYEEKKDTMSDSFKTRLEEDMEKQKATFEGKYTIHSLEGLDIDELREICAKEKLSYDADISGAHDEEVVKLQKLIIDKTSGDDSIQDGNQTINEILELKYKELLEEKQRLIETGKSKTGELRDIQMINERIKLLEELMRKKNEQFADMKFEKESLKQKETLFAMREEFFESDSFQGKIEHMGDLCVKIEDSIRRYLSERGITDSKGESLKELETAQEEILDRLLNNLIQMDSTDSFFTTEDLFNSFNREMSELLQGWFDIQKDLFDFFSELGLDGPYLRNLEDLYLTENKEKNKAEDEKDHLQKKVELLEDYLQKLEKQLESDGSEAHKESLLLAKELTKFKQVILKFIPVQFLSGGLLTAGDTKMSLEDRKSDNSKTLTTGGGKPFNQYGGTNELDNLFNFIDKDNTGFITRAEFITALRGTGDKNEKIRELLGLPQKITDKEREKFESVFQKMDDDESKQISLAEFKAYFDPKSEKAKEMYKTEVVTPQMLENYLVSCKDLEEINDIWRKENEELKSVQAEKKKEYESKIRDLTASLNSVTAQKQGLDASVSNLNQQIKQKDDETAKLQQNIFILETDLALSEQKVRDYDILSEQNKEFQTRIQGLESETLEMRRLRDSNESLEARLEQRNEEYEILMKEKQALYDEKNALNGQIKELQTTVSSLNGQLKAAQASNEELVAKHAEDLDSKIQNIKDTEGGFRESLEKELQELRNQIAELERNRTEIDKERENSENMSKQVQELIDKLSSKSSTDLLDDNTGYMYEFLKQLLTRVGELQSAYDDYSDLIKSLKDTQKLTEEQVDVYSQHANISSEESSEIPSEVPAEHNQGTSEVSQSQVSPSSPLEDYVEYETKPSLTGYRESNSFPDSDLPTFDKDDMDGGGNKYSLKKKRSKKKRSKNKNLYKRSKQKLKNKSVKKNNKKRKFSIKKYKFI